MINFVITFTMCLVYISLCILITSLVCLLIKYIIDEFKNS